MKFTIETIKKNNIVCSLLTGSVSHVPGVSTADSWVVMDGSYKQYTYNAGMDLQTAVPFDADSLLSAAQQGAQINEAEGWVRHLNTTALESQLKTYQTRLESYINSQNGGHSTVGDVLGTKSATIDPLPYLAGTLPYTIRARISAGDTLHQRALKPAIQRNPRPFTRALRYALYLSAHPSSMRKNALSRVG